LVSLIPHPILLERPFEVGFSATLCLPQNVTFFSFLYVLHADRPLDFDVPLLFKDSLPPFSLLSFCRPGIELICPFKSSFLPPNREPLFFTFSESKKKISIIRFRPCFFFFNSRNILMTRTLVTFCVVLVFFLFVGFLCFEFFFLHVFFFRCLFFLRVVFFSRCVCSFFFVVFFVREIEPDAYRFLFSFLGFSRHR